jgi:hypothetical protein
MGTSPKKRGKKIARETGFMGTFFFLSAVFKSALWINGCFVFCFLSTSPVKSVFQHCRPCLVFVSIWVEGPAAVFLFFFSGKRLQ